MEDASKFDEFQARALNRLYHSRQHFKNRRAAKEKADAGRGGDKEDDDDVDDADAGGLYDLGREAAGRQQSRGPPSPQAVGRNKEARLWAAVRKGDLGRVTDLVGGGEAGGGGGGYDLRKSRKGSRAGGTVLHEACRNLQLEMARSLLEMVHSRYGAGDAERFAGARDTLYSGTTALMEVCRAPGGAGASFAGLSGLCDALLEYGAPLHAQDAHGDTCIHWAARVGNMRLVRHFITHQARRGSVVAALAPNLDGRSALDVASVRHPYQFKHHEPAFQAAIAGASLRTRIYLRRRELGDAVAARRDGLEAEEVRLRGAAEAARATASAAQAASAAAKAAARRQQDEAAAQDAVEAARGKCVKWLETRQGKRALRNSAREREQEEAAKAAKGAGGGGDQYHHGAGAGGGVGSGAGGSKSQKKTPKISEESLEKERQALIAAAEKDARDTTLRAAAERNEAERKAVAARKREGKRGLAETRAVRLARLRGLVTEDIDDETGLCSLDALRAEGADEALIDGATSTTSLLAALQAL
eukprot:g2002.t1